MTNWTITICASPALPARQHLELLDQMDVTQMTRDEIFTHDQETRRVRSELDFNDLVLPGKG